jgi:hypothetical protein
MKVHNIQTEAPMFPRHIITLSGFESYRGVKRATTFFVCGLSFADGDGSMTIKAFRWGANREQASRLSEATAREVAAQIAFRFGKFPSVETVN